jgi:hypothetical protein
VQYTAGTKTLQPIQKEVPAMILLEFDCPRANPLKAT